MAIVVSTGPKKAPPSPIEHKKDRRQARVLVEGGIIIIALSFGLLFRMVAFEGVLVTSGSMQPELTKGDYTLVDHRAAIRGTWERGQVVVFQKPPTWDGEDATLVKRVIGLPGETIGLSEGRVIINGNPISEPYLKEQPDPQDVPPFKLGADQYYMMGDNRNNSDDSRENGPVEGQYIQGRVLYHLWPLSRFGAVKSAEYGVPGQPALNG
jgi:signal peptidase I